MIARGSPSTAVVPDKNWARALCEKQLAPPVRESFPNFSYNHFARFIIKQGILTSSTPSQPITKYVLIRFLVVKTYHTRLAPELPDLELEFYLGDGFSGWRYDFHVSIFMFSSRRHPF